MKSIKFIGVVIACMFHFISWGQGIAFQESNLDAALEKAKSENKLVFVDFMADWCEPCTQLARNVFTKPEVADYFNTHFICVRVNVDKERDLAQQYSIQALPTLVFLNRQGKEQKRLIGGTEIHMMYWAKVLTGREPAMEDLWERHRKNKEDLNLAQRILQEMPIYSLALGSRADAEKWQLRVEKLFNEYWKKKPRTEMVNAEDLGIIMLYSQGWKEENEAVEFVIKHFDEFVNFVPAHVLVSYLASYADALVKSLARAGSLEYKQVLARLQGDLKPVFDAVQTRSLPVAELMTAKADALYALYGEKDQAKYVQLQRGLLERMGDLAGKEDYQNIAMDLLLKVNDKLAKESAQQVLIWLDKLISFPMEVSEKTIYISAMGDCYVALADKAKAKECYNQAYLLSLQSQDPQLQMYYQQKLSGVSEEE